MGIKYIEPATGKNSFTCPHCGAISLMHFHCISYIDKNVIGLYEGKHGGNSWVQVATCHNCAKHIITHNLPAGAIIVLACSPLRITR